MSCKVIPKEEAPAVLGSQQTPANMGSDCGKCVSPELTAGLSITKMREYGEKAAQEGPPSHLVSLAAVSMRPEGSWTSFNLLFIQKHQHFINRLLLWAAFSPV